MHGTLYIGVTSNVAARVAQHRSGQGSRFAEKHGVHRLVYAEFHQTMPEAIAREKQLKSWQRAWKIRLIEESNPDWQDLS